MVKIANNIEQMMAKLMENLKTKGDIEQMIAEQGDKIRQMKANKCEKKLINDEVQILLKLKSLANNDNN